MRVINTTIMPVYNIFKIQARHYLKMYGKQVTKSPYTTQMVMAGGMTAFGDTLAQLVFEKQDKFDFSRTIKFSLSGTFYAAPVLVFWLVRLDRRLGKKFTIKKLLVDQLIGNPLVTGGFMLVNGAMNGLSMEQSCKMMQKDFAGMMLGAWPFWSGVALVNFNFVPLNYRLLVIKLASLVWNTYLAVKVKLAHDSVKLIEDEINEGVDEILQTEQVQHY